jgi:lipoprotein-releasing system ATP-binding protein
LDSHTTESVYQLFRKINEDLGTTFIMITPDRRVAEKTDRIIEITDGKITLDISEFSRFPHLLQHNIKTRSQIYNL